MYHIIFIVALALTPFASVYAQAPSQQPESMPANHECLLNTTDEVWSAVGLSGEQLKEVRSIQTLCQTDCTALQERGGSDPALAEAMLQKYREDVRKLLTKDQFDQWNSWCDKRPAKG